MGIWSYSPFGNDYAADFAFELDDAASVMEVERLLSAACVGAELPRSVASTGLAPACVGYAAASLILAARSPHCLGEEDRSYRPARWYPPLVFEHEEELRQRARGVELVLRQWATSEVLDSDELRVIREYLHRLGRLRECTESA